MRLFTNLGIENNYSDEKELLNLREMREWHKDLVSFSGEKLTFNDFLNSFVEIDSKTGEGFFTSNNANETYKLTVDFANCSSRNIIDYDVESI